MIPDRFVGKNNSGGGRSRSAREASSHEQCSQNVDQPFLKATSLPFRKSPTQIPSFEVRRDFWFD
jgi:hypothetical protein